LKQDYKSSYQEYLRSDAWKCKESPSGAHHWIESRIPSEERNAFQCIYCGQEKQFGNLVKAIR